MQRKDTVEGQRLDDDGRDWRRWGPYVSERAWGTVREDYSADGSAWEYFPFDHARSRAFRWNEDGIGGICDDRQLLCFGWAFWNGHDPIIKERMFGLNGHEGNHGEDAKEYWWYTDSTPTHSWMTMKYWYPQAEFPYARLRDENQHRSKQEPEFELLDTGIFDLDRYWDIDITYAKADQEDICIQLSVTNRGPTTETIDVLPTMWFRNTWSYSTDNSRPTIEQVGESLVADHNDLGRMILRWDDPTYGGTGPEGEAMFCDNDTNNALLYESEGPLFPKDAIGDQIVSGKTETNPNKIGTKAALRWQLTIAPGQTSSVRLRLSRDGRPVDNAWRSGVRARRADADEFYAAITPAGTDREDAMIMRRAFAGMLWSKQFYHYDVNRWLDGDPTEPSPPSERKQGRNRDWRHLNNADVISMPDKWEYPWYATWDLGFHCVALAHVDPAFAKHQLLLICREWFMHANGQLPAYEWNFSDVNPPVFAWAALKVFEIDGSTDHRFLERMMHKLLLNFTWWVNRKDAEGNNVFEGGFLGLDNIGPIDRSGALPPGSTLEQADATAWMAMYCLNLLEMSIVLSDHDDTYEDLCSKFFEHCAAISAALQTTGIWDEEDGFYYDVLRSESGVRRPIRARSMVGLLPLGAVTTIHGETLAGLTRFANSINWFSDNRPEIARHLVSNHAVGTNESLLLSVTSIDQIKRMLHRALDSEEFLSPYGLRGLSRAHLDHPFEMRIGDVDARVDYEPGESTSGLFGGNSNWRGPVWFPLNYLLIGALRRYGQFFGDAVLIECPTGSGQMLPFEEIANVLSTRLITVFRQDHNMRRPVHGDYEKFTTDPRWHDMIPFHEYFHGDTGAGLGASHQTGWTGLVANLIIETNTKTPSVADEK